MSLVAIKKEDNVIMEISLEGIRKIGFLQLKQLKQVMQWNNYF